MNNVQKQNYISINAYAENKCKITFSKEEKEVVSSLLELKRPKRLLRILHNFEDEEGIK